MIVDRVLEISAAALCLAKQSAKSRTNRPDRAESVTSDSDPEADERLELRHGGASRDPGPSRGRPGKTIAAGSRRSRGPADLPGGDGESDRSRGSTQGAASRDDLTPERCGSPASKVDPFRIDPGVGRRPREVQRGGPIGALFRGEARWHRGWRARDRSSAAGIISGLSPGVRTGRCGAMGPPCARGVRPQTRSLRASNVSPRCLARSRIFRNAWRKQRMIVTPLNNARQAAWVAGQPSVLTVSGRYSGSRRRASSRNTP